MLKRTHLIDGQWIAGSTTFANRPAVGPPDEFSDGDAVMVDRAVEAAEAAFTSYSRTTGAERGAFLRRIAEEIEERSGDLTSIATRESALPESRIQGERKRTVDQLRMFAGFIEADDHLDTRHDAAIPDRLPAPRPDLRLVHRPIGPVAVFGASNFPLAFSTAGGDTASALAAGCPVVVKGHPAHPGTSDVVAQAVDAAIAGCGLHPGVFGLVQGSGHDVGVALVRHPLIAAAGFTGSLAAGRALFDLCAARPEPIPFYGEFGSINPVFVLPAALARRGPEVADGWVASLTNGAGQFCTKPGILVVCRGTGADRFSAAAAVAAGEVGGQTMLTDAIAAEFVRGSTRLHESSATRSLFEGASEGRAACPQLLTVTGEDFLADASLAEEVFGPIGIVVVVDDVEQMVELATGLGGQLTGTLLMDPDDADTARRLLPILERRAGRVLVNGFPTGVEVAHAMVHGGPYPATSNFGATSVGTLAIRRFLRPVCYQNLPEGLLEGDPELFGRPVGAGAGREGVLPGKRVRPGGSRRRRVGP